MIITWQGYSCFKIQGKDVTVLIDPFSSEIGYKLGKQHADLVLITHDHPFHSDMDQVADDPLIFDTPGEYEAKDVFVYGIKTYHDKKNGEEKGQNTIFRFEMEGISIVHLGDLAHPLSPEVIEKLATVDILMIPVGGGDALNYKEAIDVINEIEPRIVIPMHYQIPGQKTKLDGVEKFAKEMGVSAAATEDKFKIVKKELPEENTKTIILKQA